MGLPMPAFTCPHGRGAPSARVALPTLPWGCLPRVRLPASSWGTLFPGCTPHVEVGHYTPPYGCPHSRGAVFIVEGPYAVSFESSASFWAALPRHARALVVVWCRTSASGCPNAAFAFPRRCVVSNLGIGLSTLLWVSLPQRSLPLVIVWCRTSASGCPSVVSGGRGKKECRKRATTKVVAHFHDTPAGPPISWVPPCIPPSISPG